MRNVGFGDIIWSEPIVSYFIDREEDVYLYTSHSCIFDNYPSEHLFINRYDKLLPLSRNLVSLQFEKYPKMHYLECFRKQAAIPDLELRYPKLFLSENEKKKIIPRPYVILHLDAYPIESNYRNAFNIDWKKVISFLKAEGYDVYQISKKKLKFLAPGITTKDFRDVMSVIYNADLFIGLDSGPSHIAASLGIPSVIFFGSVNPYFRHLNNHNKVFLQSPCSHPHCYHEFPDVFGQPCRLVSKDEKPPCCIFDTDQVIQAASSLIGTKEKTV